MKLRVNTPTRLHWGLLRPVPRADGSRAFGGMGLTLTGPGVNLLAESANTTEFMGPFAKRMEIFFERYKTATESEGLSTFGPIRLEVESAPPAHCGLGSGTQLGLAIAWALARIAGHSEEVTFLARHAGRALRSSLGCQGFAQGGLLLDPGHLPDGGFPKAEWPECREDFPEDWPILVFLAEEPGAWHGNREKQAFQRLESSDRVSNTMEKLARGSILPAVRSRNFQTLCEAVHEFNRLAGDSFAKVQGGAYSSPRIAGLIDRLFALGIKGCGQSSWGPAVFALIDNHEKAEWVFNQLREECVYGAWIAKAQNHGAIIKDLEI